MYLNWHQAQSMRTQLTFIQFLGEFNLQTINIAECNNLQGTRPTWIEWDKPGNSTAQLQRYTLLWHCPSHKSCHVVCKKCFFWKCFNCSPRPTAESEFKLDLPHIVCNGAAWSSISIIRARSVQCMSSLRLSSGSQAEQAWQWFRVCPADSDSDQGRTLSLSDLVLNLTA